MLFLSAVLIVLLGLAAAFAMGGSDGNMKFVCNFRDEDEINSWKVSGARAEWTSTTEDGADIEGVALEMEAVRGGAMHLVLLGGEGFTTLSYDADSGMPSDWSGYEKLVFNFENGSEFMINMHLVLTDGAGATCRADNIWICRSRNQLEIPLCEIRTDSGEPLDLSMVRKMEIEIRSQEKFERDLWLYQFHLRRAADPVVERSDDTVLIDFGPLGGRIINGAALLHEKSEYAPWRGFGWTRGSEALAGTSAKSLDELGGTWIFGDMVSEPAALRVDLPDGSYRARFYGGNYTNKIVPVRSFSLWVNGAEVASKAAHADTYYTSEGHFQGIDNWFEPGEDVFEKYIKPFYQEHDFDFEVSGGSVELEWRDTLAGFGLLIAPAAGFSRCADAVDDARRACFAEAAQEPPRPQGAVAASSEDRKRGFVLWSRPTFEEVGVYDLPSENELSPGSLKVAAARGQRETATFTVTPLDEIGELTVEVGDLTGDAGTIPASAVEVWVLKYGWSGWPASLTPWILWPASTAVTFPGANVRFFLTLTPPEDAAGIYRGQVRIRSASGGTSSVDLEAEVRPFSLDEDHGVSYAWWRHSPYNMNYCMMYFLPEKMDYFRRLNEAEAAHLKARGCTGYSFTAPILKGVDGPNVELDMTVLDIETEVCLKYGLSGPDCPGMVFLLPDVARHLFPETRYGDYMEPEDISSIPEEDKVEEFSELFNARYLDVVTKLQAYFESKGLNVLMYPSDEPRERNTNRWNRNIEDTIRYCDLIRANVPGARVYVDPMRDENSGVDYVHLVDHVDVLGTHPWDQSSRFIRHCMEKGRPDLAYFNAIMWDRYDFGLEVAAAGAKAFWQWHYQWDLVPFQPFHVGFKWGVTVPGPDGPIDRPRVELVANAIDDYRYFATLQGRVAAARAAGRARAEADAAEKALQELLADAPAYPSVEDYRPSKKPRTSVSGKTLDEWRAVFAGHIESIDAAM